MRLFILPVTGDHGMLLTHTCADEAELTTAVRSLVQVHKVHINAVPRQGGVELGVELHQRFVEDSQAVNPHFGRGEGMQPDHHPCTAIVVVSVTTDSGNLVRGSSQRL